MLTGENKGKIDKVWNTFWSGGISDPLRVIEQISFLLFIKRLDDLHTAREKQANRLGTPIKEPIFGPGQENSALVALPGVRGRGDVQDCQPGGLPLHQEPARWRRYRL